MLKIIITDFFGTLMPDDIQAAEYQCGYSSNLINDAFRMSKILNNTQYSNKILDKTIGLIDNSINDFLDEGNILKIITSNAGRAEGINFFLEQIVPRFKSIEKYNNQIKIYFADMEEDSNNSILEKSNLFKENNKTSFIYNNIKFGLLNKKEDIFDIIQQQYNLIDVNLFSLGNDIKDLPMLIKCIELGEISLIIKQNLYISPEYVNKSLDEIISYKVWIDYFIMIANMAFKEKTNFLTYGYKDKRMFIKNIENQISYNKLVSFKKMELYHSLINQQLDIAQLLKEKVIYDITNQPFYDIDYNAYKLFIECLINKLKINPTFRDFKDRTLAVSKKMLN